MRGIAVVEQCGVELVEVLRTEPVESVSADAGDEVLADGGLVALCGVRRGLWTRWESLEPAHVALDLCLGDPAAAADVHGMQLSALHERVHRGATDAEGLRSLFGSEEEPIRGHGVPKRLQITHVDLSRISRAFLRDGFPCHGGAAAFRTSPVPPQSA
jgi:hypothetical protein